MTHSNFIDAAMSYVETFDVPVFPCEPLGKRPLARLAPNGLKNATTDKATIEKWGRAVPDANVGVVTGIAFDAFDIDAAGWSTIARLVNDHGCMTLGPVAITPNNGAHDLFAATGLGNRAGFKPGLDWRGAKGYIVGVGSILPTGRYEWAIPPDNAPLVDAPTWLVELLTRRPETTSAPSSRPTSAYGRNALLAECGRVAVAPSGERNDTLNRAAFSLGQLVAGGVLDVDDVIDSLLVAAERCGLEMQEARNTIASGLRSGAARPRRVS